MDLEFWDLNSLTVEELQELSDLQKVSGLPTQELLMQWSKKNPGRLKKLGELKNEEFIVNEINENGISEVKGNKAFDKIFRKVNDADKKDNN